MTSLPILRSLLPAVLAALLGLGPAVVRAQPVEFGSSDAPSEQLQRFWWRHQSTLDVMGGLSLISDQWRAAATVSFDAVTRPVTAHLEGTLRGGPLGDYEPDLDEPYDLLRLVHFARLNTPPRSRLYLRAGYLDRMRLGTGHLVNFFNSSVAWDERTVGIEGLYRHPAVDVAAFTDNVLLNGITGGRLAVRPFLWEGDLRTRSVEVGFNYVTDLRTRTDSTDYLTGYNIDFSFNALTSGEIRLSPFASFAWYPAYGSGLSFGADLASDNFIDLARFRFRVALYYDGSGFIPGYVGSFYQVSRPGARILNSEAYLVGEREYRYEAVSLAGALGGNSLLTELRLLFFERFELWYSFRRHYGSQSLSEYHLRLFLHAPNRLRVDIGLDRGGLLGLISLLNELGDQSALVFGVDYRVGGAFWAYIRSRYTFEDQGLAPDGTRAFLIQRRFEPQTGLRLTF